MPAPTRGVQRKVALGAVALLAAVASSAALMPAIGSASSHREAPLLLNDPLLDNTDVYAFVSPDPAAAGTVTLAANWIPFQEPNGGPNFYPWAEGVAYDINVDNDGDAVPDIVYRWTFKDNRRNPSSILYNTGQVTSLRDADLKFYQTYTLQSIAETGTVTTIVRGGRVAPSRVGPASMPSYEALSNEAITPTTNGGKSWVGQSDDSFFLDLRVFDLLYGGNLDGDGDFDESGQDTLDGYNVNSVALQLPKEALALAGNATRNPVIGVWSTTSRQSVEVRNTDGTASSSGSLVQVSRLGNPLVNELVVPSGLKNQYNATKPTGDGAFLPIVQDPEVPKLIEAIYGIPRPAAPRDDLVAVFLTGNATLNQHTMNQDAPDANIRPSEQMRLNMSIGPASSPNRLGVVGGDTAGYPNGRRLADDTVDITLQVAEGILRPNPAPGVSSLSDGVDTNDGGFRSAFPYFQVANTIAVNRQ